MRLLTRKLDELLIGEGDKRSHFCNAFYEDCAQLFEDLHGLVVADSQIQESHE